ncbi:class E sortase [Streptomyces sp. BI20]|uniref:class E sortase n=1 Tax=Streptomyces sp. BI20 TaxID=3403460 RepID=UPI003C711DF1
MTVYAPSVPPEEGRAARRRAAAEAEKRSRRKRGGHGRRRKGNPPAAEETFERAPGHVAPAPAAPGHGRGRRAAPAGRGRARPRAAARPAARRGGPAVVAARTVGELFITFGVVMLLFVAYQLWYTNVLAAHAADGAAGDLVKGWEAPAEPGKPPVTAFEPGQGFALMYIPKLDVKVPVAEGVSKPKVLDKGLVGHYGEGALKTAMPADEKGNFAVAGHRNTHGEPFRYINRLSPGDPIVVETRDAYYTYEMTSRLDQTPPSNVSVIKEIPTGSGFTEPGRYITLTTCTPEFTSTYRMIVWGRMVDERPRNAGPPPALQNRS